MARDRHDIIGFLDSILIVKDAIFWAAIGLSCVGGGLVLLWSYVSDLPGPVILTIGLVAMASIGVVFFVAAKAVVWVFGRRSANVKANDTLPANVENENNHVAPKTESKLSRVVGTIQKHANDLDEAVSSKDGKKVRVAAKSAWDFVAANIRLRKLTKLDISGMYTFSPACHGSEEAALENAPHVVTKLRTLIEQLEESDLK